MNDVSNRRVVIVGLLAALVVAVVVAQYASSDPDGLEFVAEQEGFIDTADESAVSGSPLADYGDDLTDAGWVNTAVAGLVGVVATLVVGYGVFWFARRTNRDRSSPGAT